MELDRIRSVIQETGEGLGYEVVDVELSGSGRHRILRVTIDQESGISHEDCERVSRQVSAVLDVEELISFSYTLEVSSPGLDRKLSRPGDFDRFAGRLVKVRTRLPVASQRVFRGRLEGFDNGQIRVTLEGNEPILIPLDVVAEARLEVDWKSELHAARSR